MMKKSFVFKLILLIMTAAVQIMVFAADELKVSISPNHLTEGDFATLSISIPSSGGQPSISDLPKTDGIRWTGSKGISSRMSIINGRTTSSTQIELGFIPMRSGKITIPPISVTAGRQKLSSRPITFTVRKAPDLTDDKEAAKTSAFLRLSFAEETANRKQFFVGEEIPLFLTLYVYHEYTPSADAGISLAAVPEGLGVISLDADSQRTSRKRIEDRYFNLIRFQAVLRTLAPGKLSVQAHVPLLLQEGSGFFARAVDRKNLQAKTPEITVSTLPDVPAEMTFSGLVGNGWDIRYDLSPGPYRTGEPLTLKIHAEGNGNADAFKFRTPEMDHFRLYPPEITRDPANHSASVVLTLLPLDAGDFPLRMGLAVFDTARGKYKQFPFEKALKIEKSKTVSSGAVSAPTVNSTPAVAATEEEAQQNGILYLHDLNSSPVRKLPVWKNAILPSLLLIVLGIVVCAGCFFIMLRRRAYQNDPDLNRRMTARSKRRDLLRRLSAMDENGMDPETASALNEYLNAMCGLPEGTSLSETADAVSRRSPELAEMLNELSASAWSPLGTSRKFDSAFRSRFVKCVSKISVIAIAFLLSFSVMAEEKKSIPPASEDAAKTAYDSGDFKSALQWYESKLISNGYSAAILYDIGNCFCKLDDLPRALVCYERASRLAPRNTDIRENLNFVCRKLFLEERHKLNSPADLPRYVRDMFRIDEWIVAGAAGLMLWLFGAGFAMLYGRRILLIFLTAGGLILLVSASAVVSYAISESGGKTAIVTEQNAPVYSLPSTSSGKVEMRLSAGREITISERRMDWVRIRYGKDEGWMTAGSVMPYQ